MRNLKLNKLTIAMAIGANLFSVRNSRSISKGRSLKLSNTYLSSFPFLMLEWKSRFYVYFSCSSVAFSTKSPVSGGGGWTGLIVISRSIHCGFLLESDIPQGSLVQFCFVIQSPRKNLLGAPAMNSHFILVSPRANWCFLFRLLESTLFCFLLQKVSLIVGIPLPLTLI
jgi:hypothetical protein